MFLNDINMICMHVNMRSPQHCLGMKVEQTFLFFHRLREDSKQLMKLYGSMAVDVLGFRDSYIMIGQRGLKEGHAIEYVSRQYTSLS